MSAQRQPPPGLPLPWLAFVERLLEEIVPPWVLHVRGLSAPTPVEEPLLNLCRRLDLDLQTSPGSNLQSIVAADVAILEMEPSWYSVLQGLKALGEFSRSVDQPHPVVLVPHLGPPFGQRDGYLDDGKAHDKTPQDQRHPCRVMGPKTNGGEVDTPQLQFIARQAHPLRNGCRTAVEDYLLEAPPDIRFLYLDGFHDLGVLAPQSRIRNSAFLQRLYQHPGDILHELGLPAAVEAARIDAGSLQHIYQPAPSTVRSTSAPGALPMQAMDPVAALPSVAALQEDVRRQASMLLHLRGLILDLLESNRWRIGNRIGDLYLRLRRRPASETVEPRIRQLLDEMGSWHLHEKLAARPATASNPLPVAKAAADDRFSRIVRLLGNSHADHADLDSINASIEARTRRPLSAKPLVSIILPTHNRAHLIDEAIDSVRQQSYEHWQLLVCDDGSTDDTTTRVQAHDDPRIDYLSIPHSGAAAARNHALENARGQLIAYLDSDNVWHSHFLRLQVGALLNRPAYLAAYTDYLDIQVSGASTELRPTTPWPFHYGQLVQANHVDLNTLVHHRVLYDLLGGFDPDLERLQDWDLILKYSHVADPLRIPEPCVIYRRNAAWNQISQSQDAEPARRRIRERAHSMAENGPPRRNLDRAPVTLLVELDGGSRERRITALAEALSEVRVVHRPAKDRRQFAAQALERGETVLAIGSDSLLGFALVEDLPGLLLHDPAVKAAPDVPPTMPGGAHPVATRLTPATVPPGCLYLPPCLSQSDEGIGSPAAGQLTDETPAPDVPVALASTPGASRLAAEVENLLRERGNPVLPVSGGILPPGARILLVARKGVDTNEDLLAVLLQSFSSGVPVVVPVDGSPMFRQPLREGAVHCSYEPGAAGLARALDQVSKQSELRHRTTERALRWYRQRFSARAVQTAFDLLEAAARLRYRLR